MIQSQFNLDHRLAELRQTGTELRQAQAARESIGRTRTVGDAIRTVFRGNTSPGRPAGVAAA